MTSGGANWLSGDGQYRALTSSGQATASNCRWPANRRWRLLISAPTRRVTRSPRRAGKSKSSLKLSTATVTRTARATRSGANRTNGSALPPPGASACNWSPTSRGPGCTASWTSARTASHSRSPGVNRCGCILRTRQPAACATATSYGSSTTGVPAWPGWLSTKRCGQGSPSFSTGAWYDPDPANPGFCRHGNPNVLTADRTSSTLSQGCTGQLALVEIEPYHGTPPEPSVTRPPATA